MNDNLATAGDERPPIFLAALAVANLILWLTVAVIHLS